MLSKEELQGFNWKDVDVLIVNEGEGKELLQAMRGDDDDDVGEEKDVLNALDSLNQLCQTSWIVMTKGAKGVSARVKSDGNKRRRHYDIAAAKPKQVRDTTGAGDTFAGNLTAGLMNRSSSPQQVLQWAALAAAIAVETNGAMESIPTYQDVEARNKA